MSEREQLELKCINTIRFLSVDAVQKANSGHPGAPMGSAVLNYTLWDKFLKHNPHNPSWPGRDRFVLSAGHASMLLYSVLHLTGYDISSEDIQNFRQWQSKTPGHPEINMTPGVEMTTGPLGQGFAHGVGMAMAERWMAEKFNRPDHEVVNNYTYGLVSDGDLQEGISYEAASMAGFYKLGKLIYLYMDNDIQIEGSTYLAENENVSTRFQACHWHVIGPIDGLDAATVASAIEQAKLVKDKPSLIICRTVIGYGSPLENNCNSHGAPLGEENVKAAKEKLGWPLKPEFFVPDEVQAHMREALERGMEAESKWQNILDSYRAAYPDLAKEFEQTLNGDLPDGWDDSLKDLMPQLAGEKATRVFNGQVLNALAKKVPLVGGSADLGTSVKTYLDDEADINGDNFKGRNIHFGVREHAMAAVCGGMALYGGIRPYCSTFLIFVDYMRPAVRLAALQKINSIFVFSHDSIGVGEDGPTHQPVEQLMNLRGVPNLHLIRPGDAAESVEAWKAAVMRKGGPSVLVFTRQKVKDLGRENLGSAQGLHKGAYVLWDSSDSTPDIILIGTGSELSLALEAGQTLNREGHNVRVVSFPCWKLFEKQDDAYRESVFPKNVRCRLAVEAGLKQGWEKYVGLDGDIIGMDRFGASAPANVLFKEFGITLEHTLKAARKMLTS